MFQEGDVGWHKNGAIGVNYWLENHVNVAFVTMKELETASNPSALAATWNTRSFYALARMSDSDIRYSIR